MRPRFTPDASGDADATEAYQRALAARSELDAADDTLTDRDRDDLDAEIRVGNDALEHLLKRYQPLLRHLARSLTWSTFDTDDLVAAGLSEVARAAGLWTPTGGANPRTWCLRFAKREMRRRLKQLHPPTASAADINSIPEPPDPNHGPEALTESALMLTSLTDLHNELGCCERVPTTEAPLCCERMRRELRKPNRHTFTTTWLTQ